MQIYFRHFQMNRIFRGGTHLVPRSRISRYLPSTVRKTVFLALSAIILSRKLMTHLV
jgi:hypothetical protein